MTAIDLIHGERFKQERLYPAAHDDKYVNGELALAAKAYTAKARRQIIGSTEFDRKPPPYFPWDHSTWNPEPTPIGNYMKAGALLAAEIDRLLRAGKEVPQ